MVVVPAICFLYFLELLQREVLNLRVVYSTVVHLKEGVLIGLISFKIKILFRIPFRIIF